MPSAERRRRRPRHLRCETCLEVLALRHHWDVRACRCGALTLSGRPARPTVHWLSGPGGGWSEIDDDPDDPADPGAEVAPVADAAPGSRRLGFAAPTAAGG